VVPDRVGAGVVSASGSGGLGMVGEQGRA